MIDPTAQDPATGPGNGSGPGPAHGGGSGHGNGHRPVHTVDGLPGRPRDAGSDDPRDWPVGRLLSAAARRVEREWNAHLSAWDLNHASLPVLVHLMGGPRSQRELAHLCGVTEQTTSRVLDRMERTGYVTRTEHPQDRRRHVIALTDAGRGAFLQASAPRAAEAMVTRGLTPEQVTRLHELLVIVARPETAEEQAPSTSPGANEGRLA